MGRFFWAAEGSNSTEPTLNSAVDSYIDWVYRSPGVPIPDIDVTFYEYTPSGKPTGSVAVIGLLDWALKLVSS